MAAEGEGAGGSGCLYAAGPERITTSDSEPATVNLYENIQRLNLDVNQIAPLHGRVVTIADLRKTIGK